MLLNARFYCIYLKYVGLCSGWKLNELRIRQLFLEVPGWLVEHTTIDLRVIGLSAGPH